MAKRRTSARPTALITGAAKRIGAKLARHLASEGYDIVLHYHRSAREAEALAAKLRALGATVTLRQADLADTALLGRFWKGLPPCTLLVHNASTFVHDSLGTMTASTLRTQVAVHLEAPLLLAQGFMKQLPKGKAGNIIILGDGEFGWCVAPQFFSYAVSKHAWASVIDLLAGAVAPRARANVIALGPTERNAGDSKETFAMLAREVPLKRESRISDVTAAIDYLLTAEGTTGQVISLANGFGLATYRRRLPAG